MIHLSSTEAKARAEEIPLFKDPKLSIQVVFDGLEFPSSMAILDSGEILVLEKNRGTVHMIIDP
jgi:glucose/arabinose dehydrogenase